MVAPVDQAYLPAFLYSIALAAQVDVPSLQLSDRGAEVAFALAQRWSQDDDPGDVMMTTTDKSVVRNEDEVKEKEVMMAWDTPTEDLPTDLQALWARVQTGGPIVDTRSFLEGIPIFKQIAAKAPINNHRGDSKSTQDKLLKG